MKWWTRTETIGCACIAGTAALFAAFGSWRNTLSVVVGGVMGLANLRLWRGIVGGWLHQHAASKGNLAGRLILKILLLAGIAWVILRSPLAPWGVVAGFGSTLVGYTIVALTSTE
ncbi:MAG: hypothetical protein HY543_03350 [Deltaproteobacteria bacterium]|nr:hypothetical protein [Deltaproteobacteria bacterium]